MRSFVLLLLVGASSISIIGQSRKSVSGIKLALEIQNSTVCVGDSVQFTGTLTNVGRKPTIVDTNLIGSFRIFERVNKKTGKIDADSSFATESGRPSHYKAGYIVLNPGIPFTKNTFTSIDREGFPVSGKYRMQIGYKQRLNSTFENTEIWQGTVYSNKVLIHVKNCGN